MKISVIIPAFNEESLIFQNVSTVVEFCRDNFKQTEIILVNDGSTDSTLEIMDRLAKDYREVSIIDNGVRKGKGYSLREGMKRATGDYICFTDADLSAPIWQFEKLFQWIEKGYDIVIGSRGLKRSKIELHQPWYRENMGKAFNVLIRTTTPLRFRDTQCGFKVLRRKAMEEVIARTTLNGFCFDVELLYIAKKMGFKICEVPVVWNHSPDTKLNIVSDSAKMLLELLRLRYNDCIGKYGK